MRTKGGFRQFADGKTINGAHSRHYVAASGTNAEIAKRANMEDVAWLDLTVDDISTEKEFYDSVLGWTYEQVSMGDYSDYVALNSDGGYIAGICRKRGVNTNLPSVWLPYFTVKSLDVALAAARARGGVIIDGPRDMFRGMMAVLRDPAGATFAIVELRGTSA